jgi:hypothetical protein
MQAVTSGSWNRAARGSQRIESTVMDRRYNEAVESVSGPASVG